MRKILFLLPLLVGLFLSGCNDQVEQPEATDNKPTDVKTHIDSSLSKTTQGAWQTLVESHTSGRIPRDANIIIHFKTPVIDETKIGKSAKAIFSLKPRVAGKAVYDSTQDIVFIPENPLESSKRYVVNLQPNGLKGLKDSDAPYSFSFNVIPMEYEIEMGTLRVDPDDSTLMRIDGTVLFSDKVEKDKVNKLLSARLQNKALDVSWQAEESGKQYRFTINNLRRETYVTDLLLDWDLKPLGISTQKSEKPPTINIQIPSINEFKVLDVQRISPDADKPYIQITLSENHNKNQDLDGLIRLQPIPDKAHPAPKPVAFTLAEEGNIIKLFPNDGAIGKFNVAIEAGLQSAKGASLAKKINTTIELETLKPGVRFVGKGHILPENDTLEIPFEAANVHAVQVTAFMINATNIGQFLQTNSLAGNNELARVGRYLWRKTIPLTAPNLTRWNRYSFDVSELLRSHPGSLFRLELSIDRRQSSYHCPAGTTKSRAMDKPLENYEDVDTTEASGWDGIEAYVNEEEETDYSWQWRNRNNPCTDAYFLFDENPVKDKKNFIASNIGLLAKQDGHGKLLVVATDLQTSKPLGGVKLDVQNFQHQSLATAKTNPSGIAQIDLQATPFLLVATRGKDRNYLKLNASTALSISHFDVGGEKLKHGLKGFIYGERGVWRPGDDIFMTFVLQDKDQSIPENHPVSMQLINPKGKVVQRLTNASPVGDFYPFTLNTGEGAETGKWLVKARLGGNTFSKVITIETIRPNRLKIDLTFGNENETKALYGYTDLPEGKLFAQWLHGASAAGLKADISVRFREKKTSFARFADYVFDDPARSLDSSDQLILEGRLDDTGTLVFNKQFKPESDSPGMLSAWFTSRVFEESGTFSTSKQYIDYYPYENYVGIKLPKGDTARHMLLTDQPHTVEIGSLNAKGEPVSLNQIQVTLYKIDWKWWWDTSSESLAAYSNANHRRKLQQSTLGTINGRGQWQFEIDYPDWGRYLIRACDLQGQHCTGKTVYIDWPGWAGRAQEEGNRAASTLSLFSDKKAYTVGETAVVQLPKAEKGRALVTVENGSEILSQQWVVFDDARQQVDIPVTKQMTPNVYVNVTLLQPHHKKTSDRPIRLLGIISLLVTDPQTHLQPMISTRDEWKPLSTQAIEISELNGEAMDYTLALVDEGLLGLTRFKTPDLYDYFYRKEALGVKSWDLYDDVVGAYGGKIERLLALGGGDDVQLDDAANKPKRFPPVVQYLGAFHLQSGETQKHEVTLPAYMGAVRLMLIAGKSDIKKSAYGKAEKSVFVRQPLILQASLPRVIRVGEEVIIPVTLFASKEDIKDVKLNIETDDLVSVIGGKETVVHFEKTGDKLGFLRIKAGNKTGKTHLHFVASSHQYVSQSDVYLDILRPNRETSRVTTATLEAGKTHRLTVNMHGLQGTNSATLELSTAPALGLKKHLDYLLQYPHGCLEQITSSAFPQLYLGKLMKISEQKEKKISDHVSHAIDKLRNFQNQEGDFSYWPGGNDRNKWASLYAGHFIIEAKAMGYPIPPSLLSSWLRYQRGVAQRWVAGSKDYSYVQAYRLYVLALAGKPELGAMNRFRENKAQNSSIKAKWLLAAAYQLGGQNDAAKSVVEGLVANPDTQTALHSETFSSRLSDLGLQLNALSTLGKQQDAELFIQAIADELNHSPHNTHGISWALMAVSHHLIGQKAEGIVAELAQGFSDIKDSANFSPLSSKKAYLSKDLGSTTDEILSLKIKNSSSHKLYASIISKGIPRTGDELDVSSGLELRLDYRYAGKKATLDLSDAVIQGQDIEIKAVVHNTSGQSLEHIALSQLVPTGWEIHNADYGINDKYDYKDVRDDRVYTYFSLKADESKVFTLLVNPAYTGRLYLPPVYVEAMYQATIHARKKGRWIEVSKK